MKALGFLIAFISFLFLFTQSVFAVAQLFTDNIPLTIDQLQEFEVDINFSCPGCGDSYLRGVFYPSGNSYFGYTQDNAGNWINAPGEDCIAYFKIAKVDLTPEGSWSGKLKFKPDTNNSNYSGPSEYLFKVGRYTPSCNSSSLIWSTEVTVAITGPTPTPTPTATPANTPTPTSAPTSTPTNTPIPTKTPTPTLKPSPTPTRIPVPTKKVIPTLVLGESTKNEFISLPPDAKKSLENNLIAGENKKPNSNLQKIFIVIGGVLLMACAILSFRFLMKDKQQEEV